MRAFLKAAPGSGAGYGILEIHDLGAGDASRIIIKRVSDGKTLSSGGWREGIHDLISFGQEYVEGIASIKLGPQIIDDIDPEDNYELEIPGIGATAIIMDSLNQSRISTVNGAGAWPPPPTQPQEAPMEKKSTIYEGVEETPVNPSQADINDLPSGVASIPDAEPDRAKRKGCFLLASVLFTIWIAGAWALWHWSMNTPLPDENEKSEPFELMPRAEGS